jgi:hypothetical protein
MGRRSEATKATYACLNAFARCFDVQSVDLLIAKIKSSELDPYSTLDKFVGWLAGNGAAPKPSGSTWAQSSLCWNMRMCFSIDAS